MKDPKEQKVVVLTELLDSDINNILHGIKNRRNISKRTLFISLPWPGQ